MKKEEYGKFWGSPDEGTIKGLKGKALEKRKRESKKLWEELKKMEKREKE